MLKAGKVEEVNVPTSNWTPVINHVFVALKNPLSAAAELICTAVVVSFQPREAPVRLPPYLISINHCKETPVALAVSPVVVESVGILITTCCHVFALLIV